MSSGADYGRGARLLHQLALGNRLVPEMSFDLEWSLYGRQCSNLDREHHVFVCGLARAGTTLLLRLLHQSGQFCSLTYRDMPFVLAPNLWRRLSAGSARSAAARERAHGDGILVDYDSPEALEEVFWRVFAADHYLYDGHLGPMSPEAELVARFRRYVALIGHRYAGQRYLSKNNNNLLRTGLVQAAFPESTVIVPFRDPMQHAASLHRQHLRFSEQQGRDDFIRRYMSWLGHHEFGLDHRPFRFPGYRPLSRLGPDAPEYWVDLWCACYAHLLGHFGPGTMIFIGYEALCERPWEVTGTLWSRLGLDGPPDIAGIRRADDQAIRIDNDPLLHRAQEIHDRLRGLAGADG